MMRLQGSTGLGIAIAISIALAACAQTGDESYVARNADRLQLHEQVQTDVGYMLEGMRRAHYPLVTSSVCEGALSPGCTGR